MSFRYQFARCDPASFIILCRVPFDEAGNGLQHAGIGIVEGVRRVVCWLWQGVWSKIPPSNQLCLSSSGEALGKGLHSRSLFRRSLMLKSSLASFRISTMAASSSSSLGPSASSASSGSPLGSPILRLVLCSSRPFLTSSLSIERTRASGPYHLSRL